MKLIDKVNQKAEHAELHNLDRVFEALGISGRAVLEFSTHNMQAFNEVCENSDDVDYYSFGAKKGGRVMSKILKDGHDILVRETFGKQCDGIIQDSETRWGEYLLTFENDHLEVMGFQPGHNPANVMNVVADNVRLCELRNDEALSYEYGVDHLRKAKTI